ncbi:MAG: cohesin domain-containing protein, partial [Methanosarcinales archaeon]
MRSTIYEEIPVENSGTGTLRNVRLVPSPSIADYIEFEPNEFNVKQGAPVKVRATITPPSEPAKYTGTINIYTDNGGSHRIDVSLQVLPPVLVASPDNISVSLKPYESSTKNIILHNEGSSQINNITIALSGEAGGWVILYKNFVESLQPNGDMSITATIKVPPNTAKGQYSGTINIASDAGSPSIPLEVNVLDCPVGISITEPSEINEEIRIAEIRSVFIKVKNLGCQDLNVQVGASGEIKDWIIFNPSNFTMGPSGLVPTSAKAYSEYTGIITLKGTSSSNESVSGELKVKIRTRPPTLRVKPDPIEVATYPGVAIPQTLYLENIGSTAFNKVSLSAEGLISNWISFKGNDFPISANARKYVAIEIAPPSNAALTIHKGKIVINADGVYTQVEVSVNVTPPIAPVIIPSSLNLKVPSGHTMNGTITLRDLSTGSGQVSFDVTGAITKFLKINPSDWIYTPSEKSGKIKYTVSIPSEVSGIFSGEIRLTGDVDTVIPVTITTTEPPETYLSISNTVAQTSGTVEVPININKASNIGAIDLKLEYDATVLDATSVSIGSLGGIISGNTNTAGVVTISIANVNGFNGNGSVAKVTFNVIGSEGDLSPLTL